MPRPIRAACPGRRRHRVRPHQQRRGCEGGLRVHQRPRWTCCPGRRRCASALTGAREDIRDDARTHACTHARTEPSTCTHTHARSTQLHDSTTTDRRPDTTAAVESAACLEGNESVEFHKLTLLIMKWKPTAGNAAIYEMLLAVYSVFSHGYSHTSTMVLEYFH